MAVKRAPGEVMCGIRRDINCNGEPVEVIALADMHIGDPGTNKKLIQKLIDGVRSRPNRYAVLAGDLMNTAIANSKSDSYSEQMKPSQQLAMCRDLFAPIADKILAIVPGNHEERITRSVGVDMTELLSHELGIPDVYRENSALVFLKFGHTAHSTPVIYSLYVNHGHGGGGRRVGSKMNCLQDMAQVIDADCFIVGHSHLPASFKQQTYRVSPQTSRAVLHEQLFVNTASSLSYGGYGNRGGYVPPSNSYPVITFDNTRHHMEVTL